MADPTALPLATATAQAVAMIGFPEARIPLAQAVIHLASAPKSNAVVEAINRAQADVHAGKIGAVPPALRDAHYSGAKQLGHGHDYKYPHNDVRGVVGQQYAPDDVDGATYYEPSEHGFEARLGERLAVIRAILRDR